MLNKAQARQLVEKAINKYSGKLIETGTAEDIECYITRFEATL